MSVYLPGAVRLGYGKQTRAGRLRLMAVCLLAVVMLFFSFSTTQEYYSMPIYPALALLIASSIRAGGKFVLRANIALLGITAALSLGLLAMLFAVRSCPATGTIADALKQHQEMYTLSLGHMGDLTLQSFAYLRLPLLLAAAGFAICAASVACFASQSTGSQSTRMICGVAAGMVIFFEASRLALVTLDGYLGSYPLAVAFAKQPPGQLIEGDAYYAFSSVFFYTDRRALLLNGRSNNLEYGSSAPGAPLVFIGDDEFYKKWKDRKRCYLLTSEGDLPHLGDVLGGKDWRVISVVADRYLITNLVTDK